MSFIEKKGLKISSILFDFVNKEIIPGTDIQTDKFWDGFEKTVHEPVSYTHLTLPTIYSV